MGKQFGYTPSRRLVKRHVYSHEQEEELYIAQVMGQTPREQEATPQRVEATPENTREVGGGGDGGGEQAQQIDLPTHALCSMAAFVTPVQTMMRCMTGTLSLAFCCRAGVRNHPPIDSFSDHAFSMRNSTVSGTAC